MLRMLSGKKAQNTAEYAILIALVIGGVIAMQTYAQRTLQGRLRDASVSLRDSTAEIGNTLQYEPYYSKSTSQKDKETEKVETGSEQTEGTITKTATEGYEEATTYVANAVDALERADEAGSGF